VLQALAHENGSFEPRQEPTGLPLQTLQWVGRSICNTPPGFAMHPHVNRLLASRRSSQFMSQVSQLASCFMR
jgi:2-oxoglutarate dehydrogenase complex dehydrogenase (E1) component-like enzyme